MKKMTPEELEQFIHQSLRSLPLRPAPRSLESRVMAALEQRAMIPWYHKSWSYWPAAVRAAFLVVSTSVTGAVVTAFYVGFNGIENSTAAAHAGERLSFFTNIYHVAGWIANLGAQILGSIPPLWLYGSVAFVALMYATFFGLGAAAYRTLYHHNT
jgi:hypothetical protein